MQYGPYGKPIERPKEMPVKCEVCPKYDSKTGKIWKEFTGRNNYYFKAFRIAHAFNVLPRPGGIDQQDPITLDIILGLHDMFTVHRELTDKEFQARIAGVKIGV